MCFLKHPADIGRSPDFHVDEIELIPCTVLSVSVSPPPDWGGLILYFPSDLRNFVLVTTDFSTSHSISSLTRLPLLIYEKYGGASGIFVIHFPVSEEKKRWLAERMKTLGIREDDIVERFVRSSGSGGQKVNKTSTCVYIRHIPTGIEVKCMRERNQSLNRFLARRELVERISRMAGQTTCEGVKVERLKRQKAKRKKRARLKYGLKVEA